MTVDVIAPYSPGRLGEILDALADVEGDLVAHEVAARLLDEIGDERELLVAALTPYVRSALGAKRHANNRPAPGTSRWERAADDLRVYRERINIGEQGYRALGDCSASDLHRAAELRFRHARSVEGQAERLGRLAGLLEKRGVEVVREVPVALVMEIIYA